MESLISPHVNRNTSTCKDGKTAVSQIVDFSVFHDLFTDPKLEDINYTVIYSFIVIISIYLIHRLKLKYFQGKQHTLIHENKDKKDPCAAAGSRLNEDGVSLFSLVTFSWVRPLLDKGRNRSTLSSKDMFAMPNSLNGRKVHDRFVEILQGNTKCPNGRKNTLQKALHQAYGMDFYLRCGILEFVHKLILFACPISLGMLISFFENDDEPAYYGYRCVFAFCMSLLGKALFDSIFECINMHVYCKVRISIMTTIYQKVLRMNTVSLSKFSTGEMVNFLGTDTDRVVDFLEYFHRIWIIPVEIIICIYILYHLVGIAFIGGPIVALLIIPLSKITTTKQLALSNTLMEQKDRRMKMMNEVFCGIKIIKFYTWEHHFRSVIDKLREEELQTIKWKRLLSAIIEYLWISAPILMTLLTFSVYSILGHTLTASKMFTCASVFMKISASARRLPMAFNRIIEAVTSLERIEKFVALQDIDLDIYYQRIQESNNSKKVISVNCGKFTWDEEINSVPIESRIETAKSKEEIIPSRTLTLENITIDIRKGQFIGVIGKVGAGKSSFLHAVMAEMVREDGRISVSNLDQGFALASQEPWIQQATIRDNVLFGSQFDSKKYAEILDAVSLQKDIQILPAGDKTEVGENGVTLSGGQKSRLALARAIYQDKDVYLLDDPLAAVDSHVAQHIYDKCIMGLLQKKTRILCTHHVKFLGKADLIIVMDDGGISKIGAPSEVLDDITFAEHNPLSNKTEFECDDIDNDYDGSLGEEMRATEEIKPRVFKAFLSALGKWMPIALLLSAVFMEALDKINGWWLTHWVSGSTLTITNTSASGYSCFHDNMTSPNSFHQIV
ncbi:multidrug resistance-associated protein 7-like [Pecten maximus]|uniref:multidrug resistance-associated protein 7-like n=1 Tax=Pecten maximus TaxID=6579 RepID=UPI001458943A|nr:multidrug resistance-associated protein 7-like [Pecten maximus]